MELRRIAGDKAPKDGDPVTRGIVIRLSSQDKQAIEANVERGHISKLELTLSMSEKESVDLNLHFLPEIDGELMEYPDSTSPMIEPVPHDQVDLSDHQTKIITGNSTLNLLVAQAQLDLQNLRLPPFGPEKNFPGPANAFNAGIPRYIGIFSRDILTTAWQASLFSPKYLEPALTRVGLYRGVRHDPWRDEEPDRIPHERRLNPKAALGETNRELYYGDVAATPFWIATLAAAYNWTGDRGLLKRHAETLESCCRWMEVRLKEGDGFIYYAPEIPDSEQANHHQSWKDSGEAIVDSNGRIRNPPLATAEIQGYCFLALLSASELALALGHLKRAAELVKEARALKKRFNHKFWMPEKKFFAMALDKDRKPIDSIASNIGHCLGIGIIDEDKIDPVVKRLFAPDMFSGWGIRTLSSNNPSYDPFSYHRGSVWPVENSTIAAGVAVTGYVDEALELIGSQLALATLFEKMRLPEVISGHERSPEYPVPGLYPQANLLHAWSVSAISLYIQILVGIRAFAPIRTLLVKPVLPDWLPWIEIHELHVEHAVVSLRFWRDSRGKSHWKILHREGTLFVLEQSPQLGPEITLLKRVKEAASSVGYGKIALFSLAVGGLVLARRQISRERPSGMRQLSSSIFLS